MANITLKNLVKIYNIINDDDLRIDEFNDKETKEWLKNEVNNKLKTLNKIKTHELIDIYNLIFDDMKNENWEEIGSNEEINEIILEIINNEVIDKINVIPNIKFNSDDLQNIILKPLPPPLPKQPKRYIDSDEYLKNFNQKRNKELLKDLPTHAKNLLEFHRQNTISGEYDEIFDKMITPKESNRQTIDSYKEWLEMNKKDNQENLVDEIMNSLEMSPFNWEINFEQLTNEGRKLLFPQLKQFFNDYIDNIDIISQYKLQFKVNGEWHSKAFTPEIYRKLMENLTEQNFIFDLDNRPPEYFYERGNDELPEWSLFTAIKFSKLKQTDANNDRGGTFFRYLTNNVPKVVVDYLARLQIFDTLMSKTVNKKDKVKYTQRKELNDCCFVYALQQTGEYTEEELNQIRLRINTRYLTHSSIEKLCQEFKIHLKIIYIDENANTKNKKQQTIKRAKGQKSKNYLGLSELEAKHKHIFNLFEKHYFIEEKTPFTSYYIEHMDELSEDDYNKIFNKTKNKMVVDNKPARFITSSNLVRSLFKSNHFKPITYGQASILSTVFYNEINKDSDFPLEYDDEFCTQLIAPVKRSIKESGALRRNAEPKTPRTIWYCDFECDVSGKIHKPFMCCLQSFNGKINKTFIGEDCNIQLLKFLPDNSVVYFHNLAYDIRMIAQYGINKSIIKGTKVMKGDIKYENKNIHLKDSLPILSCKLSQLPQMFNIPDIQKEIFPYKYYTFDRLRENHGKINEAGLMEDKIWTDKDYKLFNENIDKIPGCRIEGPKVGTCASGFKTLPGSENHENHFDMWKYAEFYCQQDVRILRLGFNEFRKGFLKDFNIDPFDYISISSLANEVFNQRVYYPNKNLYKLGGHVRQFCARAVYGGRCMCAYNKKWHVKKQLCDFDAVSLYPSAMARLYTVEGKPKVIEPEQLNLDFLSKQSAYIVEIVITKVNKHLAFPLIVRKVGGLNLNDDNITEPIKMTVDNITLEDLIEFQKIEFEFVKGYYWSGNRDYTIQKEIRNIFNKRLQYKKEKNPLQQLYKLIMNSCYGKTIERPVEKDYKYINEGEKFDNYWQKNYDKIVDDIKLYSSETSNIIHAIKTMRPIDKHFNFSLLGIQVLSMSKRIMNEVMCLAFDLGCHIYYQDTDSMHIEVDDLPKLVNAYKEKYNRDLIGENLGQFHSDFTSDTGRSDVQYAVESIFLMKKMYVDKLKMSDNSYEYMIRGKGLTLNSIKYEYQSHFHNNPMELYKHLYDNYSITFDLTKGQPMFIMNKDMTVSTNKVFRRKIKVSYEEGKRDGYFKY